LRSLSFIKALKEQVRGGIKTEIKAKHLLPLEIDLPDLDEQKKIANSLIKKQSMQKELNSERIRQEGYTKNLRQAILQDAIQGKLTEDWRKANPNVEPASELLKKIKAEKEKLVKDKKIKKEKPLPPITKEEIPFDLPEGWEWCRLGDIVIFTDNFDVQAKLGANELVNYVDIASIDNKRHIIKNVQPKKVGELSSRARRVLRKNYIAYSLVRPYLDNIAIIHEEKENYIGSTGLVVFSGIKIKNDYLFNLLLSQYIKDLYLKLMSGFNSLGISFESFRNTKIPLPSLIEQNIITDKIGKLMKKLNNLEIEIKQNKIIVDLLMQSVLKEAFHYKNKNSNEPSAFVRNQVHAAIIKQVAEDGGWTTEVAIAKYDHLLQEVFNLNLHYEFQAQKFGPFDAKIKRFIYSGLGKNNWFIKKQGMIKLGENSKSLLAKKSELYIEAKDKMKELSDLGITKLDANKIELLSTVCHSIKQTKSTEINQLRMFMSDWPSDKNRTKAEKFSFKDTDRCLNFILDNKLHKKLLMNL